MQVSEVSRGCSVRKSLLLCLILLSAWAGRANAAGNDDALWQKANQYYTQKQYDSAVAGYEQLLQANSGNATLHYNTANAYYRLNKMGPAILHYEKAAHLDPGNKQIQDNLTLAKSRVQDNMTESNPIFFVVWWNALHHAVSANAWAIMALMVFVALLVLLYFARTMNAAFANSGRWVSLGVVSLLITGSMAWLSYDEYVHPNKAVVINTGGVFLQTPQANGKVIGSLPEGLVIELLDKQSDYYKVILQNGTSGWVAANALGVV